MRRFNTRARFFRRVLTVETPETSAPAPSDFRWGACSGEGGAGRAGVVDAGSGRRREPERCGGIAENASQNPGSPSAAPGSARIALRGPPKLLLFSSSSLPLVVFCAAGI